MKKASSRVQRVRLHEQVARNLSLKIINKEIEPESLLPNEDELTQQFGVSRTVIREAVRFMDAKGLIQVRPRIGTRVCPPSRWMLTDPTLLSWQLETDPDSQLTQKLYELRNMLEPAVARLATERATEAEIAAIVEAFAKMRDATTIEEHISADLQLHLTIVDACANKLVCSALRPLISSTLSASFKIFIRSLEMAKQSLPLHEAVIKAIKNRQPDQAEAAMRTILTNSAADVRRIATAQNNDIASQE